MNAIETINLTRKFGKLTAVGDLNLQIPAGSLFGLIGPNGAGKTTTLRMLAGLLEPSEGQIIINGVSTRDGWAEIRPQIGYMPDFFGVYEDMLVWEYLDFYARCYGLQANHRQQVTGELLELVDLADKREAYVETLSRGMRQRLCLAHALVHDPSILLLDEPFGALDALTRERMAMELARIWQANRVTVIMVTHSISEALLLADRILVLTSSPGKIGLDLAVGLARPRWEQVRYSPDFAALEQQLRQAITHTP